jgi:uncharacterized membrane protein HdeD (DUF308 family)
MSVPANMTAEMEARQRTVTFVQDMAAAMGLLVLGFPLTSATIRATLLGWILVVVSVTRFRFGHSQIAQTCTARLCHKESTRG